MEELSHLARLQLEGIDLEKVSRESGVLGLGRSVLRAAEGDIEIAVTMALCIMGAAFTVGDVSRMFDEYISQDQFFRIVEDLKERPNLDQELES